MDKFYSVHSWEVFYYQIKNYNFMYIFLLNLANIFCELSVIFNEGELIKPPPKKKKYQDSIKTFGLHISYYFE